MARILLHRMTETRKVLGYHGTTFKRAQAILESGYKMSSGSGDWLGKGTYFFEDAPRLAYFWAREKYHQGTDLAVLRSQIHLQEGHVMDLLSTRWNSILRFAYQDVADAFEHLGWSLPDQSFEQRDLDCAVINRACAILKNEKNINIKAIRAPFDDPEKIYNNSFLKKYSHVQISVRDNKIIEDKRHLDVPHRVRKPI